MTYQTRCSLQFYHPHVSLKAANDEYMLGGWRDPLALLEMLILTDDGFINTTNTTCNGQRENSRDEFPWNIPRKKIRKLSIWHLLEQGLRDRLY